MALRMLSALRPWVALVFFVGGAWLLLESYSPGLSIGDTSIPAKVDSVYGAAGFGCIAVAWHVYRRRE